MLRIRRAIEKWLWSGGKARTAIAKRAPMYFADTDYIYPYDVRLQRYRLNKLLCWHGKRQRRIMKSANGVVSYCNKCHLKHTGLHDFGLERFK